MSAGSGFRPGAAMAGGAARRAAGSPTRNHGSEVPIPNGLQFQMSADRIRFSQGWPTHVISDTHLSWTQAAPPRCRQADPTGQRSVKARNRRAPLRAQAVEHSLTPPSLKGPRGREVTALSPPASCPASQGLDRIAEDALAARVRRAVTDGRRER